MGESPNLNLSAIICKKFGLNWMGLQQIVIVITDYSVTTAITEFLKL